MSLPLRELAAAIDAYCLAPVPVEDLVALRRSVDRLEVPFSQLAARHADSGAWEDERFVSPYHWLRNACHVASGQAVDRVHVGLELENLPRSAAALAQGEIGYAHLAADCRDRPGATCLPMYGEVLPAARRGEEGLPQAGKGGAAPTNL